MKKFLFFYVFIFYFSSNLVFADIVKNITVIGNKRITNDSIQKIIDFKKNQNYELQDLNIIQKKLLETNFFSEAKINLANNNIVITLKEYPIIDFFYLRGIKNKKREDELYKSISLGSNKIFNDFVLKKDLEIIKKTYINAGYFNVKVTPKVSLLPGNVVNLVIDIERKKKYEIQKIFFIGDKFFSSSTLSDVILSSTRGWWKFLSSTSIVDIDRIEYDKNLLKVFYLNNGFYDVQITNSDIDFVSDNLANITFSINSGKKYIFSKTKVVDDTKQLKQKDISEIKKIFNKKIVNNFSIDKINQAKSKVYDYLERNKILFVDLNLSYSKTNEQKIQTLAKFVGTPRKFVNLIKVKGNDLTDEVVIRRNLEFSEGDAFENYKLKESVDNLRSTGIFKNVKSTIDQQNDIELIDVLIDVEEQPTGSITAGIGAGSSGASISGGLNENNLFGKGITLSSIINIGTQKIDGSVTVNLPDFKNSGNTLGVKIYSVSTDYTNAGYENTKIGNSYFTKYEVFDDIYLTTGLGLEFDNIDTNNSASELYKKRAGDYLTFNGYYDLVNDKRNSKFQPTSGYILGFGQNYGLPGSDITSISNNIYASSYYPYTKNFVFNIKGGFSSINSLNNNDVKLSDRKFLNNKRLRGFESLGIGPKDGKDHIGGNYSAYASLSSTFPNPLPEKWNAKSIMFLDTGNVWGVDFNSSLDKNKIRSSAGIGLEWISPLGPLSFTLAETISSASGDLEESFSFQIGSSF